MVPPNHTFSSYRFVAKDLYSFADIEEISSVKIPRNQVELVDPQPGWVLVVEQRPAGRPGCIIL